MSDKLSDPGEDLDGDGPGVGVIRAVVCEVVGEGCPADDEREQDCAGYGLQQDVEAAVKYGSDGTGVEREVRDCEP